MEYNQTYGTHTNTKCPHCGKNNTYVAQGERVVCGEIKSFKKECFYCKKMIFYLARHEIATEAYTYDPIAYLRGEKPEKSPPHSS